MTKYYREKKEDQQEQTSVTIDRERDWIQGDVISMYKKKVWSIYNR